MCFDFCLQKSIEIVSIHSVEVERKAWHGSVYMYQCIYYILLWRHYIHLLYSCMSAFKLNRLLYPIFQPKTFNRKRKLTFQLLYYNLRQSIQQNILSCHKTGFSGTLTCKFIPNLTHMKPEYKIARASYFMHTICWWCIIWPGTATVL